MNSLFQQWLAVDTSPNNFYDLFGMPQLHPHGDELKRLAAQAVRDLAPYCKHSQPAVAARAVRLRKLAEQAGRVFSSPAKKKSYDQKLHDEMVATFVETAGRNRQTWQDGNVQHWLANVQKVHPSAIPSVAQAIRKQQQQSGPSPVNRQGTTPKKVAAIAAPPASSDASRSEPKNTSNPSQPPPVLTRLPDTITANSSSAGGAGMMWVILPAIASALVIGLIGVFLLPGRGTSESPGDTLAVTDTGGENANLDSTPSRGLQETAAPQQNQGDVATSTDSPASSDTTPDTEPPVDPMTESSNQAGDSTEVQTPPDLAANNSPEPPSTTDDSATTTPSPNPTDGTQPLSFHHDGPVLAVAWGPKHRFLAVAGGGDEMVVRIWDTVTSREVVKFPGHKDLINSLSWNWAENRLASGSQDGQVRIWQLDALTQSVSSPSDSSSSDATESQPAQIKELIIKTPDLHPVKKVAWLPDNRSLLVGDSKGRFLVVDPDRGTQPVVIDAAQPTGSVRSLTVTNGSRSSGQTVSVHDDGSLFIWDLTRRKIDRSLIHSSSPIWASFHDRAVGDIASSAVTPSTGGKILHAVVHPDGKRLATAAHDLEIWKLAERGTLVRQRILPGWNGNQGYHLASWHPQAEQQVFAAADGSGHLNIWETQRWKLVSVHDCGQPIHCFNWHAEDDGSSRIALGCQDGLIQVLTLDPQLPSSVVLAPTFDVQPVVQRIQQLETDEEWEKLRLAVNLVDSYRLPPDARTLVEHATKRLEIQANYRWKEYKEEDDSDIGPSERCLHLQSTIDLAPRSESARLAERELVDLLRKVASEQKLIAKENEE